MNLSAALIPVRELKQWYEKGFTVPLVVPFKSTHDPWVFVKRVLSARNVFFLDSTRYKERSARYSYFGWDPFRIVRLKDLSDPLPLPIKIFDLNKVTLAL